MLLLKRLKHREGKQFVNVRCHWSALKRQSWGLCDLALEPGCPMLILFWSRSTFPTPLLDKPLGLVSFWQSSFSFEALRLLYNFGTQGLERSGTQRPCSLLCLCPHFHILSRPRSSAVSSKRPSLLSSACISSSSSVNEIPCLLGLTHHFRSFISLTDIHVFSLDFNSLISRVTSSSTSTVSCVYIFKFVRICKIIKKHA